MRTARASAADRAGREHPCIATLNNAVWYHFWNRIFPNTTAPPPPPPPELSLFWLLCDVVIVLFPFFFCRDVSFAGEV